MSLPGHCNVWGESQIICNNNNGEPDMFYTDNTGEHCFSGSDSIIRKVLDVLHSKYPKLILVYGVCAGTVMMISNDFSSLSYD